MGCEIVSVYADQVVGQIGYPKLALQDLADRDYTQPNKNQTHKQIMKQVKYLYGYHQSFTASYLHTFILQNRQYLLYNSLNYVVLLDVINKEQILLSHEDEIVALSVNGNNVVTGSVGGKLTLWNLELREQKLTLRLPKNNKFIRKNLKLQQHQQPNNVVMNFSAIGLTKKYVICTDTTQPHNIAYCFDIETGKLLAIAELPSNEPTYKGIGFGEYHLVTIGADGVWFIKYSHHHSIFQITKGIFGKFPKTSMCSLTKISNEFILSGGVDGYIFIWSTHYECQRVYKLFDCAIMSISINEKHIIAAGLLCKTKCLSYQLVRLDNSKTQQRQGDPASVELQYTIVANYDTIFSVQNIAFSKLQSDFCYLQSRGGELISRIVPLKMVRELRKVPLVQKTFTNLNTFRSQIDFQLQHSEVSRKEQSQQLYLWTVGYPKLKDKHFFNITRIEINETKKFDEKNVSYYMQLQLKVASNYQIRKKINKKAPYAFCLQLQHICYVKTQGQLDTLHVFECSQSTVNIQSANQERKEFIIESGGSKKNGQMESLSYVKLKSAEGTTMKIYLLIEQQRKLVAFQVSKQGYEQIAVIKLPENYKQQSSQQLYLEEAVEIYWNKKLEKWTVTKDKREKERSLQNDNQFGISWTKVLSSHNGHIKNCYYSGKYGLITVGHNNLIQWHVQK